MPDVKRLVFGNSDTRARGALAERGERGTAAMSSPSQESFRQNSRTLQEKLDEVKQLVNLSESCRQRAP